MAQYYTLDEAARVLRTTPEEVRKMADEKKLRTFRDKGTLRFRAQEIDELAREKGFGSDVDLQLGEVPQPKKGASPIPKKQSRIERPSKLKKPSKLDKPPEDQSDVFDFSLSLDEEEEQVQLGALPSASTSSSKSGKKSKPPAPSPTPKPGSDSDVRLVHDSDADVFDLPLEETPAPPSPVPGKKKSKMSKLSGPDSGVRIVPLDPSDSDVKMVLDQGDDAVLLGGAKPMSASDSDIRLEQQKPGKKGSDPSMVTEEIDLDSELSKSSNPTPPPRPRPSAPQLPTTSPFELSEEDLDVDSPGHGKGTMQGQVTDSSGDFELTPEGEEFSPLELGSDEIPSLNIDSEEEVSLGELDGGSGGSGINLRDPADSGISLEQEGSDEIELDDLSLDAGATPAPQKKKAGDEEEPEPDSSEFELSLDDSDPSAEAASAESSEFELSLDDSGSSELELDIEPTGDGAADSDSEFDLTLDDSGGSSPLEESAEDKDIFETDFEVPALEEESGSEAVALDEDTDLETEESSDFDLAIDEMDVGSEDESGSQVIALDEEEVEADEDEATPRGKRKAKLLTDDEDEASEFAGIGPSDEDEDETAAAAAGGKTRVQYVEKPDAPWGPVPAMLMLPCIVVLFVVGLMGFELIQGMMSYQKTGKFSGLLIRPLTEAITGETLPGGPAKK